MSNNAMRAFQKLRAGEQTHSIVAAFLAGIYLAVIRRFNLAIYVLCSVLVPLASAPHVLLANARYVLVIVPMYPAIANWLDLRPRVWLKGATAFSAGLLGMLTLLVALGSNATAV